MAHSVELLLDPTTDAAVRRIWAGLRDRGLPNQGDHRGATNRPHVTLVASQRLTALADTELARIARERLPLRLRLGAPVVFAGTRATVALSLVVSEDLLALHRSIVDAVEPALDSDVFPHCAVDAWTPHVTLARRVPPDQLGHLLSAVDAERVDSAAYALRRWDSDARSVIEFDPT